MSKLDSLIRRMTAQRDCLNYAADLIASVDGPVLELGLGNGRTYDHLREILPTREIYVFDRRVASYPSCTPPRERIFLGEAADTLARAAREISPAALVHIDLGTTDHAANARLMAQVAPLLERVVAPGAVIISFFELSADKWQPLALPPTVKPGRYFLYRVTP